MFLRTQTKHFISWATKDKCFTDTKQALTWKRESLQQKQDNVRCWAVKVDKFYFGLLIYARYARAALYLQLYVIVNNRRFPGSTWEVILSYPPCVQKISLQTTVCRWDHAIFFKFTRIRGPYFILSVIHIPPLSVCGGTRGGAVGWGTALQTGTSRDRFPMVSLEFFFHLILPVALWHWGRLSFYQKWVPGVFPGG
jgi:hypothetical protein